MMQKWEYRAADWDELVMEAHAAGLDASWGAEVRMLP